MIEHDRYLLTEIARKFVANKWGEEDTLLECLRDGRIVASVEYPTSFPSTRRIPKSYWQDFALENFEVLDRRTPRSDEPLRFWVDKECAFDDVFAELKTIVRAAVERNPAEISPKVRQVVLNTLSRSNFDEFDDWFGLVGAFYQLAIELETDAAEYSVFVLHKHWAAFLEKRTTIELEVKTNNANPSGAPPNPYWLDMFENLVCQIIDQQDKSLTQLTNKKTKAALARSLLTWAKKQRDRPRNADPPDEETIVRRLTSLDRKRKM